MSVNVVKISVIEMSFEIKTPLAMYQSRALIDKFNFRDFIVITNINNTINWIANKFKIEKIKNLIHLSSLISQYQKITFF